jgi:molecular chaperone DnaK
MSKVIGIDLGTTNSVIAITESTKLAVIADLEDFRTTPPIVVYTKAKKLLVGPIAKRQAISNSKNTFYSVKRLIGSKLKDIDKN